VLGCLEGRSTNTWVDFDFFSHQISLHLGEPFKTTRTGRVGEHLVPMPHFGLVMLLPDWQALAERLRQAAVEFVLPPQQRFAGQPSEQWTMFFCDPFGNPIEIKGFATPQRSSRAERARVAAAGAAYGNWLRFDERRQWTAQRQPHSQHGR
jgi:extradiol dioxygenase family protein